MRAAHNPWNLKQLHIDLPNVSNRRVTVRNDPAFIPAGRRSCEWHFGTIAFASASREFRTVLSYRFGRIQRHLDLTSHLFRYRSRPHTSEFAVILLVP